ncbi:putative phage abortive infection protein [Methylobacter svalbardensis]|uniref:putative phage abortive infection protein n=1 Tax=Methylobacter svalbardensis TaxID=3080016 RepID=UPI0030ECB729
MIKHLPIWLITLVLVAFTLAVVLIYSYFFSFPFSLSKGDKWQEVWGQFGDYVGGILNPLFSLTTIFALLYTIILQSKELRESTEQLRLSAEAFQKQNTVLEKQQFETTFFQMLTLFNEIINSIETTAPISPYEDVEDVKGETIRLPNRYDADTEVIKGRKCFNEFYERLKLIYRRDHGSLSPLSEKEEIKQINELYDWFYSEHQYEFGHYFRMLYNIIKFVKNSNVTDKHFYTNIVRAQLSSQELLLLFYNALSDLGNEKFKPLIEEFALLKTIPKNELLQSATHPKLYTNTAYVNSVL